MAGRSGIGSIWFSLMMLIVILACPTAATPAFASSFANLDVSPGFCVITLIAWLSAGLMAYLSGLLLSTDPSRTLIALGDTPAAPRAACVASIFASCAIFAPCLAACFVLAMKRRSSSSFILSSFSHDPILSPRFLSWLSSPSLLTFRSIAA